jgi:hypothetical protein
MKKLFNLASLTISILLIIAVSYNPVHAGSMKQLYGTQYIDVRSPASTGASGDKKYSVFHVPWNITIEEVGYFADAAITGTNTNYVNVKVLNGGSDATGTTVIANKAFTASVNATANAETNLTLSSTAANLNLSTNDIMIYFADQNGSGMDLPAGALFIRYINR